MRILDRYIFRSVASLFFSCLFTFFFLFVIIDLFSHLDVILKNKSAFELLSDYYLSLLPSIFVQVAPFSCLLATLYTFAKLNHGSEIIAMRSAGLSVFQITKTAIVFGLLISIFVFWINDKFVPNSLLENRKTKDEIESGSKKKSRHKEDAINNLTMYGLKNRLIFVSRFLPQEKMLQGITILEHNEKQDLTRKIVARNGIYKDGVWRFYQSITYDFDQQGQLIKDPVFQEEEVMNITESPEDFMDQRQSTDYMSISQIEEYIWRLSKSGAIAVIRNLKVDLYNRMAFPFTSLIIVLLGIPFSLKIKKRATGLSSLGISLLLGFMYYVFNAISIALGKADILSPWIAATLAHIAALIWSLYLISNIP